MSVINKTVLEWIEKADHDLGSAKLIYLHIPEYFDTIAFHCQQSTEKYLKSMLLHFEIDFQRTHNLLYLVELLSQKIDVADYIYDKAIVLNGFSVQIRYPDNTIFLTNDELELSINTAQYFRDFAFKTLGLIE